MLQLFNLFSVTRVKSQGMVWVNFNVLTKDFSAHGLDNMPRSTIITTGSITTDLENMNLS